MIQDLDRSIADLLRLELPADLVEQITVSFDTPDSQFPPQSVTLPAIDLFLYDIRENTELRSNEWELTRDATGMVSKTRPPVRVECSYLITAWPSESQPRPSQDEHRLLGEVMVALLKHPSLPPEVLAGSLVGQEPPLPTSSLQSGRLQSPGEFWQALGGKPKAALHYTVTIGAEVGSPVEVGRAVVDARFNLVQK